MSYLLVCMKLKLILISNLIFFQDTLTIQKQQNRRLVIRVGRLLAILDILMKKDNYLSWTE